LKRDPHRLTYRVREIPSTWSVDDLKAALLEGLGNRFGISKDSEIRIRVLATDLCEFKRPICRTAVVSFGLEVWSPSTRFPLTGSDIVLECDKDFDGLTPLSSCGSDEHHEVEYVSSDVEPSMSIFIPNFSQLRRDPRLGRPSNWFFHGRRIPIPVDLGRNRSRLSAITCLDIWIWDESETAGCGRGCLRIR